MESVFEIGISPEYNKCLCIYFSKLKELFKSCKDRRGLYTDLLQELIPKINDLLEDSATFTVFLYLNGLQLNDLYMIRELTMYMTNFFVEHYHGKLNKCFMMNVPLHLENIYHIIRPLIHKEARSKIILV